MAAPPPKKPAPPPPQEEDDPYGNYDEDFEEYADDFDDFEEEEEEQEAPAPAPAPPATVAVKAPVAAPPAKPAPVQAATPPRARYEQENETPDSPGTILDKRFPQAAPVAKPSRPAEALMELPQSRRMVVTSSARPEDLLRRQAGASARMQRWRDLKRMVTLEAIGGDLLDMAPMSEYDLYIRSYGRSTSLQASTQCGEDNLAVEVQTEGYTCEDADMQFPDDIGSAVGRGANAAQSVALSSGAEALLSFIRKVAPVVEALLEENLSDAAPRTNDAMKAAASGSSFSAKLTEFSTSHLRFPCPKAFGKRSVVSLAFSPAHPHIVIVAYSAPESEADSRFPLAGLMCLWSTPEPLRPNKLLVCEGQITSCGLSPGGGHVAFAGTADGSLLLWDLREPPAHHTSEVVDGQISVLRGPTFSSDGLYADNHLSPITAAMALPGGGNLTSSSSSSSSPSSSSTATSSSAGLNFQIATVDARCHLKVWGVAEAPKAASGVAGLSFTGRVYAIRAVSVELRADGPLARGEASAASLGVSSSTSDFVVGADLGRTLHVSRYGEPRLPLTFVVDPASTATCTSIHFSPFTSGRLFVAGFSDGSLGVFSLASQEPLLVWHPAGPVLAARWSCTRPGLFFALCEGSMLHAFDLCKNLTAPVVTTKLSPGAIGLAIGSVKPTLALGYADGSIEVHALTEAFALPGDNEQAILEQLTASREM